MQTSVQWQRRWVAESSAWVAGANIWKNGAGTTLAADIARCSEFRQRAIFYCRRRASPPIRHRSGTFSRRCRCAGRSRLSTVDLACRHDLHRNISISSMPSEGFRSLSPSGVHPQNGPLPERQRADTEDRLDNKSQLGLSANVRTAPTIVCSAPSHRPVSPDHWIILITFRVSGSTTTVRLSITV